MLTPQDAKRRFSQIVRRPDSDISLIEAALLISAHSGPADTEGTLATLASIAHRVKSLLHAEQIFDPQLAPRETVELINQVFFEEELFTGDRCNYYNPENSRIDRVVARREGIPITLSILYMEVARQVGLPLEGIGLPGHFVVGYWPSRSRRLPLLIVDPYNAGQLLAAEDCAARVQAAYGSDVNFSLDWLQPVPHRQILTRMLNNLKQIYMAADRHSDALSVIDMLLLVQPDSLWELKDRGMLYYRTGSFLLALGDLRRYLKFAPDSDDAELVNYHVDLLRRLIVSHN